MICCLKGKNCFYLKITPWKKFRIEIHSDLIREFPNHSEICIQTSFDAERLKVRLNPIYSDSIRYDNLNESENFPIRINQNQSELRLTLTVFPILINPNHYGNELILIISD